MDSIVITPGLPTSEALARFHARFPDQFTSITLTHRVRKDYHDVVYRASVVICGECFAGEAPDPQAAVDRCLANYEEKWGAKLLQAKKALESSGYTVNPPAGTSPHPVP